MSEISQKAAAVLAEIPFTWTDSVKVFRDVEHHTGLSKRSLAQIYRWLEKKDFIDMRLATPDEAGHIQMRRKVNR